MTKRFLILLALLFVAVLSPAKSLWAQEGRQSDSSRAGTNRQQDQQRTVVVKRNVQQLRAEINTLCDEADATFGFLTSYAIAQDSVQKAGYEGLSEIITRINEARTQIASYTDNQLLAVSDSFPDSELMGRLIATLRKIRTDAGYQLSLSRAEKWFNAESQRASAAKAAKANAKTAPSAPAFTRPDCNFKNLTDYPSAADIGITQGFLLPINIILASLDPDLGNNAPNPAYYAAVAAKAITGAILLGLESARDAGLWCQDMAFNIQGAMTADGQFIIYFMFPNLYVSGGNPFPNFGGGYADFLKDFVHAIYEQARDNGVPVQCANTRLTEADAYYNQQDWPNAYKKYRDAYANIGADVCQPAQ